MRGRDEKIYDIKLKQIRRQVVAPQPGRECGDSVVSAAAIMYVVTSWSAVFDRDASSAVLSLFDAVQTNID